MKTEFIIKRIQGFPPHKSNYDFYLGDGAYTVSELTAFKYDTYAKAEEIVKRQCAVHPGCHFQIDKLFSA